MPESHAFRALGKKRQVQASELAHIEIHRKTLLNRLRWLGEVLKVMSDGQIGSILPGRKRRSLFRHGVLQRLVCGVLRNASCEIDNLATARVVIAHMDWDSDDDELLRLITEKARDARTRVRTAVNGN